MREKRRVTHQSRVLSNRNVAQNTVLRVRDEEGGPLALDGDGGDRYLHGSAADQAGPRARGAGALRVVRCGVAVLAVVKRPSFLWSLFVCQVQGIARGRGFNTIVCVWVFFGRSAEPLPAGLVLLCMRAELVF